MSPFRNIAVIYGFSIVAFFLPFLIGLVINKITDNISSPGTMKSTTKSLLKKNN
ncbi:uncharacterized protein METZ01_LOCUS288825 [marine metagenome]|uniref:Uncharacterized protein n=1 Tax=marine metagenome TaxID=408172 RepID=A0A382LM51_9ZZZZ